MLSRCHAVVEHHPSRITPFAALSKRLYIVAIVLATARRLPSVSPMLGANRHYQQGSLGALYARISRQINVPLQRAHFEESTRGVYVDLTGGHDVEDVDNDVVKTEKLGFEGDQMSMNEIEHIVVLMLENRSFDSMLGWLYEKDSPAQ